MNATERQYGREDVSYDTWYSPWVKALALIHTRAELEQRLAVNRASAPAASHAHLAAIQATGSMQSQSQRRAQSGNLARALGEEASALRGALEIYDLFPEHTKEGAG